MPDNSKSRRPLKSRGTAWASALTRLVLKTGITPNQISLLGVGISMIGAGAMLATGGRPWLWLVAALCLQLRLLANMLDGLVAVEGQKGSPLGALFNELPDRVEDSLFLIAAGYAADFAWMGWLAALLAALTAYVRAVGASLGQASDFRGPMAKPHRMAALTLGALASFFVALAGGDVPVMRYILAIIIAGCVITLWRRTAGIAARLQDAAK